MATVMAQFRGDPGGPPTLVEVAARFDVPIEAFDPTFGVVATDRRAGLYTVLVDESSSEAWRGSPDPATGVFSNPQIESTEPDS